MSAPMTPSQVRRAARQRQREVLERLMERDLQASSVPPHAREMRFHPIRGWRFDFAWPEQKLALEVDGGTWSGGRHTRGAGFERDCEKLNTAAIDGWRVLRVTGRMVRNGEAIKLVEKALGVRQER